MNNDKTHKRIRRAKVITLKHLVAFLECSPRTARRRLREWGAYTSINKNGGYYTLPDVPHFDENGLWRYSTIVFSRNGNLKKTLIHLIRSSSSGLNGQEISRLVGIRSNSAFLSRLRSIPEIVREKHQGSYVYFSSDGETYHRQLQFRTHRRVDIHHLPSDAVAVAVLVQFIKNPRLSSEEMAYNLSSRGTKVTPGEITRLLEHHDLLKKTVESER